MKINTLKDINIYNKKLLIRVDFNVPIENNIIKDDYRLKQVESTINYCLSQNCSIVLMSHLGRPEGFNSDYSMLPLVEYLQDQYHVFVHYSEDCISSEAINLSNKLLSKEIHLLDNLRFYKEEINNCSDFAEKLSKHAEIYVNDAFGVSHREHASNHSIVNYFNERCIGFLMEKEIHYFSDESILQHSTVVIGGAKTSSKLKMLYNFIGKADYILMGGAMAFTFLKAKNINIGKSLYEKKMIDKALDIINKCEKNNTKLLLPFDIVGSKSLESQECDVYNVNLIENDIIGLDIGPETCLNYSIVLNNSKKIIWNGPMGKFEEMRYATGTQSICFDIKESSKNNIVTIVGGGDTVRAINSFSNVNSFTHVSTGGGASLKILSGDKLLSIQKLYKNG